MSEKNIPAFGVSKIKEFSFLLNESLFELNKPIKIQFQHLTKFSGKDNLIDLTLRVHYSYSTENEISTESTLIDFHVQNVFVLEDLKLYKTVNSEYILPQNLIASMVGIAISHTRSLMANNIANTVYQNNIIPIVNPMEVAEAFYPEMFKTKENNNNLQGNLKTEQRISRVNGIKKKK